MTFLRRCLERLGWLRHAVQMATAAETKKVAEIMGRRWRAVGLQNLPEPCLNVPCTTQTSCWLGGPLALIIEPSLDRIRSREKVRYHFYHFKDQLPLVFARKCDSLRVSANAVLFYNSGCRHPLRHALRSRVSVLRNRRGETGSRLAKETA